LKIRRHHEASISKGFEDWGMSLLEAFSIKKSRRIMKRERKGELLYISVFPISLSSLSTLILKLDKLIV